MKIAITTSSFGQFDSLPLDLCKEAGIECILNPYGRALSEDEALALYADCIGVIAGTEPITAKVMEANPQLKIISRCGVGTDNVDKAYATAHDITVLCTPNAPTQATAEQAVTLMLSLLRHTSIMDSDMRNGIWKKRMGNLLTQKKVGIIGYGRIGKTVAKLLSGFDCEIACHDPYIKDCDCPNYSLEEFFAWAEIITLHCNKEKNAPPLIDAKALSSMRENSWIVNCARGDLIDEEALIEALQSKHIKGAALDVFVKEPYQGELLKLENVLLNPHASSYAKEARIEMEMQAAKNLLGALGK